MVHVELLCDVAEGGRNLAEAIKAADSFGLPKHDNHYPRLKMTVTRRGIVKFTKGTVVTMHEAGAEKWVKAGVAKVVKAPPATPTVAQAQE